MWELGVGVRVWKQGCKKGIYRYIYTNIYIHTSIQQIPKSPTAVINVEMLLGATHVYVEIYTRMYI
jgi:hypothetical protein